MSAIEARLIAVERIQSANLPKLLNALRRIGKMEKAVQANTAGIGELKLLAKQDADIRAANAQKLDDILGLMQHAKSVTGFIRRHSPKVIAFAIGIAITKGWITAENGQNFLHLFGL